MPLSENIEGTTAHFILNSIHCCSSTPLAPLSIFLSAGGHVNTCRKPFANPPLHTQLKRSSASFLVSVVVAVGRVSKLPNFFLGFLLLFPFFSFSASACSTCRCRLPHAAARRRLSTYYLVKGVRRLQFEIVMAKRETAAATTSEQTGGEWGK